LPDEPSRLILCPYCGNTQADPKDRCAACGGFFDNLSLKVTQQHMGPWFIRDRHHPFRPGCSYEVLRKQIERGKVKPTTILRGPTTRQFWSVARNVPGVAHLMGYCHECGGHVDRDAEQCPHCRARFFEPRIRDKMGLAAAGSEIPSHGKLTGTGADADAPGGDASELRLDFDDNGAAPGQGATPPQAAGAATGATTATGGGPATSGGSGDSGGSGRGGGGGGAAGGSPILAGMRSDPSAASTGGGAGAGGAEQRGPEAVAQATSQARRARDAMSWMTAEGDSEPDTLVTAGQPTATLPRQTNWWTWLLIAINVGLFAVVIAAAVIIINGQPEPGGPGSSAGPGDGPVAVRPGDGPVQSGANGGTSGQGDGGANAGDAGNGGANAGGADGEGDGDGDDDNDGSAGDGGTANNGGGGNGAPTAGEDSTPLGIDGANGGESIFEAPEGGGPVGAERWAERFKEAGELADRGDYAEALKMLKAIRAEAPASDQPEGLDKAIERVEAEMKREAEELFG